MLMTLPEITLNSILDPQWQLKKQRPTSLGDRKNSGGTNWAVRKALNAARESIQERAGFIGLQAENIISDKEAK